MSCFPPSANATYQTAVSEQAGITMPGGKYKHRDFDFDLENQLMPFSTDKNAKSFESPSRGMARSSSSEYSEIDSTEPSSDIILCELRGVVLKRDDLFIQVKIDDMVFDFPKILFQGISSVLKLGQRLRYQVCKNNSGLRYQKFLIENEPFENPRKQEVMSLIERIIS